MPAPHDVAGRGRGGLVEVLRRRRPPVDQDLRAALVGQAEAADVPAGVLGALAQVQAPEAEPVLHRPQLGEPVLVERRERVPLEAVLVGAGRLGAAHLGELLGGLLPQLVQPGVEAADVRVLGGDDPGDLPGLGLRDDVRVRLRRLAHSVGSPRAGRLRRAANGTEEE